MDRSPPPRPDDDDIRNHAPYWLYAVAFVALLGGGYLFGELAEAARKTQPDDIDRTVPAWVMAHRHASPAVTRMFRSVTRLGNFLVADALILAVAAALVVLHRERMWGARLADAYLWIGVTMAGRILNFALKAWFKRKRPPDEHWLIEETWFSFPSGHAVFAGVFFGMLALLILRPTPGRPLWVRVAGVAACAVMAFLVAASRVWLGVHYPTDVIGGLLVGLGWVVAAWVIRSGWARWRDRHGIAAKAGRIPRPDGPLRRA